MRSESSLFELATDFSERSGCWGSALPMIYGLAVGCRARSMIEIGVFCGGSTLALLFAAEANNGQLISIDINDCSQVTPESLRHRWTFLQGDSRKILESPGVLGGPPIDFAVVDGEHTNDAVTIELRALDALRTPGATFLLDDCCPEFQGVLDAFMAFCPDAPIEKRLIPYGIERSYLGKSRTAGLIRYLDSK